MIQSLRYFWRIHLAVVGAAAICTAVLAGALVVGDSVRQSLRDLTLERLGAIDQALLSESFFGQDLASRLLAEPAIAERLDAAVPAIVLRGSVVAADSGARASQVGMVGVDQDFLALFDQPESSTLLSLLVKADGQFAPSVVLNEALRRELDVEVGAELVLSLARPSDVPRESLLGSTEASDVISTRRVVVRGVVPDRGFGRFGLEPSQTLPLNAFLDLGELQRALDRRGQVNAVLLAQTPRIGPSENLADLVDSALTLDDLGVQIAARDGFVELTSRDILLRPQIEAAIEAYARELDLGSLSVSTYLANQTRPAGSAAVLEGDGKGGEPSLPYSTIAALDLERVGPAAMDDSLGRLSLIDGSPAPPLGDGDVLLNSWAAEQIGVEAGDRVEIDYWQVGDREQLLPRTVELVVKGVVAIQGLGGDRLLTPPFPGISDADDMSDWEPTFPVDLSRIGPRDEEYWDLYGALPKLFVAGPLGRRLWGGRFGDLTSVRLLPADGDAEALLARVRSELPSRIEPRAAGLSVLPVKAQGLRAATGATDFSGLFIGFSLFLIVSAAMLTVLFFRLGVEQRAKEIGARLALGFPARKVRRLLLGEGAFLAGVGTLFGLGLAVGYAWLMMVALKTIWIGATGAPFLSLSIKPVSLLAGGLGSMVLVGLSIWWSVRKIARLPVIGLLRGVSRSESAGGSGRWAPRIAAASLLLAMVLFAASFAVAQNLAAPIFLGLGAVLLVAGLATFAIVLGRSGRDTIERPGAVAVLRLAWANSALNPGRSVLSVALVASAVFVIVAVGAYGHRFGEETRDRQSGAGGFTLVAESDVPIYQDLASEEGRQELGFSAQASALLGTATVVPFRVLPGDDVSCLNLYQPERPRLLGAPLELIERGGFQFQQVLSDRMAALGDSQNPWSLLETPFDDGAIPAIGDFNSVMWILKSGLGRDVAMVDEAGQTIRLRIVGLLRRSIFQSELLISERLLLEHFPSRSGYSFFLIEPEIGGDVASAEALEQALGRFGFDTTTTAQRLQSYQAVENTYLGTFQTLGGLGLLLGTLGLAVILLRNILERRAELATLRAIGFRRSVLGWTVLAENSLVLLAGVGLGAVAALIAVSPHLRGGQALVPWGALLSTLVLVLVVGTLACAAAVRQVLRSPLLPALRAE